MVGPVPVGVNSFEFEVGENLPFYKITSLMTFNIHLLSFFFLGSSTSSFSYTSHGSHRCNSYSSHVFLCWSWIRSNRILCQHGICWSNIEGSLWRITRRGSPCEWCTGTGSNPTRRWPREKRTERKTSSNAFQHQMVKTCSVPLLLSFSRDILS